MTDEEIDTSDIPPQGDAFFARAKWRLPRLYIYRQDFRDALSFAAYILDNHFHTKKSEKQQLVHQALNTSLIMAYSRPFTGNKDLNGDYEKLKLKDAVSEVLTGTKARSLHGKVLDLRNGVYAHSQADKYEIRDLNYEKYSLMHYPDKLLNEADTTSLKALIKDWIGYLDQRIRLMKKH